MDSYIRDMYPQEGEDQRGNAIPRGGMNPGLQVSQANEPVPELPSNGIQRMQAAHAARMNRAANNNQRGGRDISRLRRSDARSNVLKEWNAKCKIQSITIPQLVSSPSCSKRYRITLTWLDENGRPHRKDINFGEQGKQEFIDHRDPAIRDARLAKMEEETLINPLHPNYWKFHMLNKYPDITVSYMKFIQDNGLMNRKLVLKKEFRQNLETESAPARTDSKRSAASNRLPPNIAAMIPQGHENDEMLLDELNDYEYSNEF